MFLNSFDHFKHLTNLLCAYTTRNVKKISIFSETSCSKTAKTHWFYLKSAFEGASISKNHCQLTFAAIKMDWGVVRPSCLFLRIDMIPRKPTSANIVVPKHFKNFLAHFNSTAHDGQHPLFESQKSYLSAILSKTHKNECLLAFLQIKNDSDTFGAHHWCFWNALIILNTLPTYLVPIGRIS